MKGVYFLMILLKISLEFIKIGSFAFGGGFSTLPFIYQLSEQTNWFSFDEVNNMVTISQMTPGPLACNMSTYVGFKLAGIVGGIIATISFVIPAILLMAIVCKFMNKFKDNEKVTTILKYIRASTFASILVSCTIILKMSFLRNTSINFKCVLLVIITTIVMRKIKLHPIFYMIICGIIGIIFDVGGI